MANTLNTASKYYNTFTGDYRAAIRQYFKIEKCEDNCVGPSRSRVNTGFPLFSAPRLHNVSLFDNTAQAAVPRQGHRSGWNYLSGAALAAQLSGRRRGDLYLKAKIISTFY